MDQINFVRCAATMPRGFTMGFGPVRAARPSSSEAFRVRNKLLIKKSFKNFMQMLCLKHAGVPRMIGNKLRNFIWHSLILTNVKVVLGQTNCNSLVKIVYFNQKNLQCKF